MTNDEIIARLSDFLEIFKKADSTRWKYQQVTATRVDSIFRDGSNNSGGRYTPNEDGTGHTISCETLVGLNGCQLVVCRDSEDNLDSTSYAVYAETRGTFTQLTIEQVPELFSFVGIILRAIYTESAVSMMTPIVNDQRIIEPSS